MPRTKITIMAMIDRMANSLNMPSPRFHGPILSHFEVPQANRPSAIGIAKEKNRKMTVQETTIEYTGVSPIETSEDPHTNRTDRIEPVQMAATGVRYCGLTFERALEAGRPPSRENAKIMRDTDVTVARPHSHWLTKIAR